MLENIIADFKTGFYGLALGAVLASNYGCVHAQQARGSDCLVYTPYTRAENEAYYKARSIEDAEKKKKDETIGLLEIKF